MLKFNADQNKAIQKRFDISKARKSYEPTILANELDGAFRRFDENFSFVYEPKRGDLGWHPSGDCLPPVTELWEKAYSLTHPDHATYVRPDMSRLNKTFMVGHYWHQIIQYLVVKEGWAQESSIERVKYRSWGAKGGLRDATDEDEGFKPFHYVRGQGDIAPLKVDKWIGLVDIKTMNPMDFKAGFAQSRFAHKYTAQINIYMDLFDLDQALILAVDKGSAAFREYTFVRNPDLIDQIYRKWRRVSYLIRSDKRPTKRDDFNYKISALEEE